jgi:DNA-binding CsgD family transcriptional regulator
MSLRREDLQDNVVAVLRASQELPRSAEGSLAEILVGYLQGSRPAPRSRTPIFYVVCSALVWGVVLTWLGSTWLSLSGRHFGTFALLIDAALSLALLAVLGVITLYVRSITIGAGGIPLVRGLACAWTSAHESVVPGLAGASTRTAEAGTIAQASHDVSHGMPGFSLEVLREIAARSEPESESLLSQRDRELLILIGRGWDNKQIAACLNLNVQTVRNYLSGTYRKIGVSSRSEAVAWVYGHGLMRGL